VRSCLCRFDFGFFFLLSDFARLCFFQDSRRASFCSFGFVYSKRMHVDACLLSFFFCRDLSR
jgi:hypothetical protein